MGERNTHNHGHINHHQNNHREKKGNQPVSTQPRQQLCGDLCDDDDELVTEDSQIANWAPRITDDKVVVKKSRDNELVTVDCLWRGLCDNELDTWVSQARVNAKWRVSEVRVKADWRMSEESVKANWNNTRVHSICSGLIEISDGTKSVGPNLSIRNVFR